MSTMMVTALAAAPATIILSMVPVRSTFFALTGTIALCACFTAVPSASASAGCARWDVSGQWLATQSNEFTASFSLRQNGAHIEGSASYLRRPAGSILNPNPGAETIRGAVEGSIGGNSFVITAVWSNGSIGEYLGSIGPHGQMRGTTRDKRHPASTAKWESRQFAKCSEVTMYGPIVGGTSAEIRHEVECRSYAMLAEKQNNENIARQCGFTGDRWNSNAPRHFTWCLAVSHAATLSEKAARSKDLANCPVPKAVPNTRRPITTRDDRLQR